MNINATLIGQLIMFIMFTWFCMKFIWPPIMSSMHERRKRIEESLLGAEDALIEKNNAKEESRVIILAAKEQASSIISVAEKQASEVIDDSKDDAKIEAGKILKGAQAELNMNIVHARDELRDEVSSLVVKGVNAVLKTEMDEKKHKKFLTSLSNSL
jgi:F-type H+-transporting ATPase subunit b